MKSDEDSEHELISSCFGRPKIPEYQIRYESALEFYSWEPILVESSQDS